MGFLTSSSQLFDPWGVVANATVLTFLFGSYEKDVWIVLLYM